MMQRTFGPIVGLDPMVPVGPHPDDNVICSDGTDCKRSEAFIDCQGDPHSNDEDRIEQDVAIVTDILGKEDEWVTEYCTENDDYTSAYDCIVDEDRHTHAGHVEQWLRDKYGDISGYTKFDDNMKELVDAVVEEIDGPFNCDIYEYDSSDYNCYSGSGCCLCSIEIGEYENQIDFDRHPALQVLHDKGILDDILDDVNCDVYVNRNRRREKNEKTGYYEPVGRETYGADAEYPNILAYHNPGGQWHFIVDAEIMDQCVTEAIITLCRKNDS